jgi:BirA family biotin operon repressor/biotin-[acetyl-CoA-carboxylase] ligase
MNWIGDDLRGAAAAIARTGSALGAPLELLAETTSTSDLAKHAARLGAPHGSTWVAEAQQQGRGRQGRTWSAARGESLLLSVIVRVVCPVARLPELALAAGLAVASAVRIKAPEADARVKWPNDVVSAGKKLGGILVESVGVTANAAALVVGVGLNVNTRVFPPDLADRATSVALLSGQPCDRGQLLALILAELDRDLSLVAARGLSAIAARLSAVDALRGARICTDDGTVGIARGIDASGRLRVERPDGTIATLVAGEVHLVPPPPH